MLSSTTTSHCLCIVYISVSQPKVVNQLISIVQNNLLHTFEDQTYNRTSFYISGPNILDSVSNLCRNAFMLLDHSSHKGTHPTLGSIDNICFSPLGTQATISEVVNISNQFAKHLSEQEHIQVYNYGEASLQKNRLQYIRRKLGYFDKNYNSLSSTTVTQQYNSDIIPDFGYEYEYNSKKGITCIGAIPLVINYNLRFRPGDSKSLVLQVTKQIRATDVEALTLQHEEGCYEVACNLLNPKYGTSPNELFIQAQKISEGLSIQILKAYTTGPTEDELLNKLAILNNNNTK